MGILSFDPEFALPSSSLPVPGVPKGVGVRVKSKKNERNGVEKGFKPSSPDFYCSLGIFGFSSKLQFCHYTLKFSL